MNVINCAIEDSLLYDVDDHLVVQIFETQPGEEHDTAAGGDSIIIDDDDIEGDFSIFDIAANPDRFEVVELDPRSDTAGYYIREKEIHRDAQACKKHKE